MGFDTWTFSLRGGGGVGVRVRDLQWDGDEKEASIAT